MRAWHVCHEWKLALGASAKCGSTMLADLVQRSSATPARDARYHRRDFTGVPSRYDLVYIVRHPVARFLSLYRNIQERPRDPLNFYKQLEGLEPLPCFERLLELSPDLTYDFHFQPQTLALGPLSGSQQLTIVRLEAFADWWRREGPKGAAQPKWLNKSVRDVASWPNGLAEAVKAKYQDDYRLWEGAWDLSHAFSARATPSPT